MKKILYHIQNLNIHSNEWQQDAEFTITKDYQAELYNLVAHFKSYCYNDGIFYNVNYIKNNFKQIEENGFDVLNYFTALKTYLGNFNILRIETFLEQYRKDKNSNIPSRLNSLFLTNQDSLEYWYKFIGSPDAKVFEVEADGKLFRTSDSFYPSENLSNEELYNKAKEYWQPEFKTIEQNKKVEYLFQGKIKVLKEI